MVWLKIGLSFVILFVWMSLVKFSLKKIFKIEKEKQGWVSYNHINKLHQKVDWTVRITAMLALITIIYLLMFIEYPLNFFWGAWILLTVIDYSVRGFFEWKYSDNPKQSILTMGEMVILVIGIVVILQFDMLNLVYY
ncbi:hypothetical protein A1A1_16635 [Planococcus antarcticus DSM 14505]|uniref:DUF4181 domain-containing protein n=1 Tax=Planococcus antarcticus DSM 14505 TaxID=1185653 RepID=A0A1C7DDR2_9BACL|nr:DUF4181 domain-containing protein [Planococcus antarcticus]ANU09626.1 hypothetical protein BBH88_04605 [Planococcus antarcticus DSM 14505]EIM05367.1 hypothetical protein A1A1_16635 [Planococcus antarcticus DSM 14505]